VLGRLPFNSLCKTTMSFRFNCYYSAEKPCFFIVDLDQNHSVFHLVREVRGILLSEYRLHPRHDDLQLFKAGFSFSGTKSINTQQTDILLESRTDLPSLAFQWLHPSRQKRDDTSRALIFVFRSAFIRRDSYHRF